MKKLLLFTLFLSLASFASEEVIVAPFVRTDNDKLEINLDSLKNAQKIKAGEKRAEEAQKKKINLDTEMIMQQKAVDYATGKPDSAAFPL